MYGQIPDEKGISSILWWVTDVCMAMNRERVVFEVFIKVCPDFAGEPIKEWYVLDDWYAATGNGRPAHPFDNRA